MGFSWGVLLGSCLVSVALGMAQTTQGSLSGSVVGSLTGQPIPDAKVRCVNLSSEAGFENTTGRDGRFVLPLLSPGTYRIWVDAGEAWQSQVLDNLDLPVSANLELRFRLRPSADVWQQTQHRSVFRPDQSVLVFFGPDLDVSRTGSFEGNDGRKFSLEPSVSNVIDPAQVRELPLAGRDVYTMLVTEPGVAASTAIGRGLGVSAGGQRPSSSNFLLDGLQNNNYLTTGPLSTAAPEAVQEYRLSISGFSAEYGGTSGFVANAVTRAGTAEWHGLAYLYLKRHTLNANDFQRNSRGEGRLPAREFEPGFRAGGPLWKKAVFGSLAFEALRFRSEVPLRSFTVPTSLFVPRAGSIAEGLLRRFAPPEVTNPSGPLATIQLSPRTSIDRFLALPRVDLPAGRKHRVFGRAAINRFERPDLSWSPYPAFNVPLIQTTLGIAAGWTAMISPGLTSELRAGRGSQSLSIQRPNGDVPFLVTLDRGVNLPGSTFSYDLRNRDRNWEIVENLVWTAGPHTVKSGGQLLERSLDGFLNFLPSGLYRFQNLDAFGADQIRSVAFSAARQPATLDGGVTENPLLPDTRRAYRYRQYALFVQDAWRLTPRLAVNFGIRYEDFGVPRATGSQRDLLVEPGPGSTVRQRILGAAPGFQTSPSLYRSRNGDWSSRAGFSYALDGKGRTLLRGAYGTFYDRPFDNYWQPLRENSVVNAGSSSVDPVDYLQPLAQAARAFHQVTYFAQSPRLTIYDRDVRSARAHNYFLGLQRQFGGALVLEAAGLGSRSSRLTTTDLVNRAFSLPPPQPGSRVINPSLPPDLFYRASNGRARYDAFALTARYRAGRAQVHAAYTLGRAWDNQSDALAGDFFNLGFTRTGIPSAIVPLPSYTVQFDPAPDWGHADFDQRHNLVFYSLWELPAPAGSGTWAQLRRGWRVSQMAAFRSGLPFSVIASSRDGALIGPRADLVSPEEAFVRTPYPGGVRLLNPDGFREPASGSYGNTSRNAFHGPGFWSVDFSLGRAFTPRALGEGRRIVVRADAFNLLNHANLNNPETFLPADSAAAPFGVALYGRRDLGSGFPTLVPFDETGRQIQILLRLEF